VQGDGVVADKAEAAKWFRKAADQNYPAAQYNMGVFYYNGDGVKKDFIEAYKWLLIARATGVAEADALCKRLRSKMATAEISEAETRVKKWQQAFEQSQSAKK
jgi:TPR repeat protein